MRSKWKRGGEGGIIRGEERREKGEKGGREREEGEGEKRIEGERGGDKKGRRDQKKEGDNEGKKKRKEEGRENYYECEENFAHWLIVKESWPCGVEQLSLQVASQSDIWLLRLL